MTLILIYSIWIIFAVIMGFFEAYYFSAIYNHIIKRAKFDHEIFTIFRGIIAALLLYFSLGITWSSLFIGAAFMAIFPWFHDGMYYLMRDNLDNVYPERWKAHSTTSTAKFDFNYEQRCFGGCIAFLLTLIQFAV